MLQTHQWAFIFIEREKLSDAAIEASKGDKVVRCSINHLP